MARLIVTIALGGLLLFTGVVIHATAENYSRSNNGSTSPEASNSQPISVPAGCSHLYNVGRHQEWAECMGVGYR